MNAQTPPRSTSSGGGRDGSTHHRDCTCEKFTPECEDPGLLRPRFFAGQLLTEDDLEQINAYQGAKRRLTNRYVLGAGVVCGLRVAIVPDEDKKGWLTVSPGYALDCCGDDIVLPCPYAFNINGMIREAGLECDKPCAETRGGEGAPEDGGREYLLYIRYREVEAEPISPYSPEGKTGCENSRVRETCRFELRCRTETEPPRDLRSRVAALVKGRPGDEAFATDAQRWNDLCQNRDVLASPNFAVQLTAEDLAALNGAPASIAAIAFPGPDTTRDPAAIDKALNDAVTALQGPARTYARFLFVGKDAGTTLVGSSAPIETPEALDDKRKQTRAALNLAVARLRSSVSPGSSPAAQTRARLLADEVERWAADETRDETRLEALRKRVDVRLFVMDGKPRNEPYSFDRYRDAVASFNTLREALRKRAASGPAGTSAAVGRSVPTLAAPEGDDFNAESLKTLCDQLDAARALSAARSRLLRDELCAALIPPCTPCDDPAVLLARVEVKDCEVVRVCNFVRSIIPTPAALRYWSPIDQVLEALCCGTGQDDPRAVLAGWLEPLRQAGNLLLESGRDTAPTRSVEASS